MRKGPIQVLLVDDSPFVRKAFSRVLADVPDVKVAGEAADGERALQLCRSLSPDVVLLDLGMPVMDGMAVLRVLRKEMPSLKVVVVSAAAQRGAEATLAALEMGAFDFVDKTAVSTMALHELGAEVLAKIRAAAASRRHSAPAVRPSAKGAFAAPELLVMGASTGGPPALAAVLKELPANIPVPIVLVQHIPASFVSALAEHFASVASIPACEAMPGEELQPGKIYVIPGGHNAEIVRQGSGLYWVQQSAPPGTPHVPSVDALFHSAARCCGPRACGVLLTGMGRDGAEGLLAIRRAGGLTIAQDEATSAVYGMPRVAAELGAAFAVLPLHAIPSLLVETFEVSRFRAVSTGA